ncbi:hypothetical protein AGMMS50276_33490 [Synergistales bacterium]|nr:hypothetical protein AGMMS50276_33490 [Synergistales bacterium]
MIGAIVGDIVGSVYEWDNIKTKDFPLFNDKNFFTDDTVITPPKVIDNTNQGEEMFTRLWLEREGFEGFKTVQSLSDTQSRKAIPQKSGVYILYCAKKDGAVGKILYIGKAEKLRRRLSQYIRQAPNHRGGRAIWDLPNYYYSDFVVCWKCYDNPRKAEAHLIQCHKEKFGQRPFANKQG